MLIQNENLHFLIKTQYNDSLFLNVTLCVVSKKNARIKPIDFNNKEIEILMSKMNHWVEERRLVTMVETQGEFNAHVAEELIGKVTHQEAQFAGKSVTVSKMTNEELDCLKLFVASFQEYSWSNKKEDKHEHDAEESTRDKIRLLKEQMERDRRMKDSQMRVMRLEWWLLQMQNIPEKAKLNFLQKMNEILKIIQQQAKEKAMKDEPLEEKKRARQILKQIRHADIIKEDIAKIELITELSKS